MLILAGLGNGWLSAGDQHTAGILLVALSFEGDLTKQLRRIADKVGVRQTL